MVVTWMIENPLIGQIAIMVERGIIGAQGFVRTVVRLRAVSMEIVSVRSVVNPTLRIRTWIRRHTQRIMLGNVGRGVGGATRLFFVGMMGVMVVRDHARSRDLVVAHGRGI